MRLLSFLLILAALLSACGQAPDPPETSVSIEIPSAEQEQAVPDMPKAAYETATADQPLPSIPLETEFSFVVDDEKHILTLGPQEGTFPWGHALEGTLLSSSPADTYGTAYEMDCGRLQLSYCVFDDGTEYLFRMSTAVPYDQPDAVYTSRDFYCGYDEEHLTRAYIPAVTWDAFRSEEYDACYLYEPAGTRHIAFLLKDGVVAEIEMEDLMDGRLLPED